MTLGSTTHGTMIHGITIITIMVLITGHTMVPVRTMDRTMDPDMVRGIDHIHHNISDHRSLKADPMVQVMVLNLIKTDRKVNGDQQQLREGSRS